MYKKVIERSKQVVTETASFAIIVLARNIF